MSRGEGSFLFIYYEQLKREVQRIHISVCRCNERLKVKTDGSKELVYTGLSGDVEHITIQTRLTDESFKCVMGECDLEYICVPSTFSLIHSATSLSRM